MSSPTIGAPLFNDLLPSLLFATHPSGGSRNKRIRLGASSTWQSAAVVPYALLFRRPLHLYPRRLSLRNRPFHLYGPYQHGSFERVLQPFKRLASSGIHTVCRRSDLLLNTHHDERKRRERRSSTRLACAPLLWSFSLYL